MRFAYLFETAIGTCGCAWDDGKTAILRFSLPQPSRSALLDRLGGAIAEAPPHWVILVAERVKRHLASTPDDFADVSLDLSELTSLFARIYTRLREFRPGATITYGELAKAIGKPGGARLVGQAMGANPLPLLVPCHRVLAANGDGGFSAYGGVATKARLLAIEGVSLVRQGELF